MWQVDVQKISKILVKLKIMNLTTDQYLAGWEPYFCWHKTRIDMWFFFSIHWNCSNILIYIWFQCIIHLTVTRYNLNGDLTLSLTVRVVIKCLTSNSYAQKNLKSPWCVLLLRCSTNANRVGSLSLGLVAHQKQHEAGITSPLPQAPSTSDLTLSSVRLPALALDRADLSRSFYSMCQLDEGAGSSFFPSSERLIEMGKTENLKCKKKGSGETEEFYIKCYSKALQGSFSFSFFNTLMIFF